MRGSSRRQNREGGHRLAPSPRRVSPLSQATPRPSRRTPWAGSGCSCARELPAECDRHGLALTSLQ